MEEGGDIFRDPRTNAILFSNTSEFESSRKRSTFMERQQKDINNLKKEVSEIKDNISKILDLLTKKD
jgi:hypothetical protein